MQSIESGLIAAFERVRQTLPGARTVGLTVDPERSPEHRYYAAVHHDGDLGSGCVVGYGDSTASALDDLCAHLVRLLAEQRALTLCVACTAGGEETPGEVTTGDGMMCSEHAIEWLQSERQAADESVGPCGVKS